MADINFNNDIRYMKQYDTKEWVNVHDFILEMKRLHPNITIHVGTDSQFADGVSHYVTVVAIRIGKRGVTGLYKSKKEGIFGAPVQNITRKRKKRRRKKGKGGKNDAAITYRLRRETDFSIEVAEHVKKVAQIKTIDLDYNNDTKHLSNKVKEEMEGYCKGMGYVPTVKPQLQIATPMADKLCRKY